MRGVADRLGVKLAPTTMSYSAREPRGGIPVTLRECVDGAEALVKPENVEPYASVRDVLEATPLQQGVRDAVAARIQISFAQPVERLDSAVLLTHHAASFEGNQALRGEQGNQQIALRLAEELGDRVRLNTPVRAIAWEGDQVRVHTADGTVEADTCVITVPASVWRNIEFTPALPDWKAAALDAVEYGHAAKIAVELPEPLPASAILSVPDFLWTWSATRGRTTPDPVLNCFVGSDTALATLAIAQGPQALLQRLAQIHPDLHLDPARALLSTWDNDPWVRAAYSTRVPGRDHDAKALQRPVGPLHFAGEHTCDDNFALMDGAVDSGQRAAAEIVG
ncbi:flavin monoamine oxidase family protein [Streptomyces sp. NPDC004752]